MFLGFCTSLAGHLDNERASLNGVDVDEPRLEVRVRGPGSRERDDSTSLGRIVLRVDVKEPGLAYSGAGWVGRDRADVKYP